MRDVGAVRGKVSGDQFSDWLDDELAKTLADAGGQSNDPMDSEAGKNEHRRLLEWYFLERDRQAENRMEMAVDADFYDGIQWNADDAAEVRGRGQMPLVYNEIAPMVDWIIGTERRSRVDWKVLPRTADDVQDADNKTKVLKYVSDINRTVYQRSQAFADAVKVGIGWTDSGACDDPTKDILYSRYEDWRNVLWDSSGYELDLSDSRYLFRWRWVDEDVALAAFPDQAHKIRRNVIDAAHQLDAGDDEFSYLGETMERSSGRLYAAGAGVIADARRRRIKLIEAQYSRPVKVRVVTDGPFRGAYLNDSDRTLRSIVERHGYGILERVAMRKHCAIFTEADMIASAASVYRHNSFGLTPIWCYRRSRDRLPYGVIRRVRDINMDINKRASKASFWLNVNQIVADDDATEDWNELRDEADRPDGVIRRKKGSMVELRSGADKANSQIEMMSLGRGSIMRTGGVADENMGRQTNAVSGEAIKARQLQGSVVTTEPFDNLRLATQVDGEKQLSLVEQFYTEEKVIRITGARGKIDWLEVNKPEQQPDGSVRYLNDITATKGDFVVSEQDYAGTLRQVMFDSLNNIAGRVAPEVAMRLLTIAFEFSDLPNHDDIAAAFRAITGERDPNKEMSPEEAQQMEEQMRQQAEALQYQRETAILTLQEGREKVRKLAAEADRLTAEAQRLAKESIEGGGGQPGDDIERAIRAVQAQAQQQIDDLAGQLRKAQIESANRTLQIGRESDTSIETARIDADAKVRVAEIQAASDKRLMALDQKLQALSEALSKASAAPKQEQTEAPEPADVPVTNIELHVNVDAKPAASKKVVSVSRGADGQLTGTITTDQEEVDG